MVRFFHKSSKSSGAIPGELIHVGRKNTERVSIDVIDYSIEDFRERKIGDYRELFKYKTNQNVTWININGIHDTKLIQEVGRIFNLHPLILEDIVNTTQRPKYEDFEDYIFVVLKMLHYDDHKKNLDSEQVSLIVGGNFVISFQERKGDVFEDVRERIRKNKGRIRKKSSDYLIHSLIDAVVDDYFLVLEKIGDNTEAVEKNLLSDSTPETLQVIQNLKKQIVFLRKTVWPLREVVMRLEKTEFCLIGRDTAVFFRDVYDHTIQIIENIETLRDVTSGMTDLYLSSVNNKMSEVMKTLTIIATIFIPLTFIAGIYGMNFNTEISRFNMPELNWKYGYIFILTVMVFIFLMMFIYFKKKKW